MVIGTQVHLNTPPFCLTFGITGPNIPEPLSKAGSMIAPNVFKRNQLFGLRVDAMVRKCYRTDKKQNLCSLGIPEIHHVS